MISRASDTPTQQTPPRDQPAPTERSATAERRRRPWHLYLLSAVGVVLAVLALADIGPATSSARTSTQIVTAEDLSGSIVLQRGSIIDVSSGGYVGSTGKLAVGSDGLPEGKGGNLSLATYAGSWVGNVVDPSSLSPGTINYAPQTAANANVVVDGAIYAGGLSQGGSFALQVPEVVIDGQAAQVTSVVSGAQAGTVVLPTSFFTNSGFGSYKLTSTYGSTTVTAGTTLTLKQQNYRIPALAGLPGTGERARDFAALGYAPDGLRHAENLTLIHNTTSGLLDDRGSTAEVLVDQGAQIAGDPLANITLGGTTAMVLGSIVAPGGTIAITPQYAWIGADAVLDVSGTFVRDPRVTAYSTGTVLPGGTITLSGAAVVALAGSVFDISGGRATY